MPQQQQQQQQRSRWVDDASGVVDSVTRLLDSLGFGTRTPDFRGPLDSGECPPELVRVNGVCECPSGQEYKDGRCQKKGGSTLLWVGVGLVAITGAYFLVTKFKNK